jgi:membrane peptidoglycan carboxypeptidase
VQAADGTVLYQAAPDAGEQRFPPQVARNVTESMLDVARDSFIPLADDRQVAAKTGTTQNSVQGQNNDAWTVGYTPSLSTAVWVGTDDNSPIKTSAGQPIYGRMVAGSIWQKFMNTALRGTPEERFSRFVPLGDPPDDSSDYSDESDDSESSDDSNHSQRHHHRHHGHDSNGQDSCDVVQCDDNGNPVTDGRDSSSHDHNGDNN